MLKVFLFFLVFSICVYAHENSFREKLLSIQDISDQLKIGLNSFPGRNEDIINDYVKDHHLKSPFRVVVKYGKIAGETKERKTIYAATIYFVNPLVTTGFLWWKRVKYHYVNEPDWTLFKNKEKPLKSADVSAIKSLFKW